MSVFEVERPALVVGSTQPWSAADAGRAAAAGVEVVRRHSGGGAVLLRPGAVAWVDVLVPTGDRLWDRDVNRAFLWLGRAWAAALADVGVGGATVHDGPLVRSLWSARACFAGLGPGEVIVEGRKVVGMSSRRRREGALFQCAALVEWDPDGIAELVGAPRAELERVARGAGAGADELAGALLGRLAVL